MGEFFFLQESLAKAIELLTEKERTVVSLFYYEDLSLSEIAEVMSLSPSRISQLHSKAILRLRGALARYKGSCSKIPDQKSRPHGRQISVSDAKSGGNPSCLNKGSLWSITSK